MFNPFRFLWRVNNRFKKWDADHIRKYQKKQIKRLLKFTAKKSAFYSSFYKDYDLSNFNSLPFMNKQLFMENFSELNTKGLTKEECIEHCLEKEKSRDFSEYYKGYLVGMSTGTSGNRGIEFATKLEAFLMQLLVFFRFPFPKVRKIHLAFILRVFSPGFSHNGVKIRISYVNPLDTFEAIVNNLNSLNPNIISGPPSVLHVLTKEKKKDTLKIDPIMLVSYGEILTPNVKEIIESSFKCPVVEVYKSSESFIALPCNHGNLHINEDTTFVEVLDNKGQPVKPGEPGYVVVTDFIKYGTPIIRYRLNDLITVSQDACPCGSSFRIIQEIHGRADDVVIGAKKTEEGFQFILPDFIRRSIVSSSDYIEEYNATQTSPTDLTIKLQLKPELQKSSKKESFVVDIEKSIQENISHVFLKHDSKIPELEFIYTIITHDFDTKLRRIKRTFKEDF